MRTFPTRNLLAALLAAAFAHGALAADLPSVEVSPGAASAASGFDGVVEAVRQTVVAAQVPGAVIQLNVRAGDRVSAGQVLLRIDARAAEQNAAAGDAQVSAARASLEVATKELERQRQLFQKSYISRAAFERAESEFKATQAQVNAQMAQAGAAHTQAGFHLVRAPFAGVVSEVPVSLGDMAMPGRPLLTLYDPSALRVTASVPQGVAAQWTPSRPPRIEIPGLPQGLAEVTPSQAQLLPAVDPATHTMQVRADLPATLKGLAPGMFARMWLPLEGPAADRRAATFTVPSQAIVRRAELTALYVLAPSGKPVLRQVRLGRVEGERTEVLTGLSAGERVVTDPQAAARVR